MPDFEILEHTADIGVRAFGSTLADLFVSAALGVQSIALESDRINPAESYEVNATGEDTESLLVNWLNEVIYFLDAKRIAFARFDIKTFSDHEIAAQAWGEPFNAERHDFQITVKAATWHQLKISYEQDRWVAEVYLDI